jgi:hypothetical protein
MTNFNAERFYDRVMKANIIPQSQITDFRGAPIIAVDNVHDYMINETNSGHRYGMEDFPNLAPPFPIFWMESQRARNVRGTGSVGMLLWTDRMVPGMRSAYGELYARDIERGVNEVTSMLQLSQRLDVEWLSTMMLMLEVDGRPVRGPALAYGVRGDGTFIEGSLIMMGNSGLIKHGDEQTWGDYLMQATLPMFMSISLLHCKNVELEDRKGGTRQMRRAAEREAAKGRAYRVKPPTEYKVLSIDPMKKVLRRAAAEGGDIGTGLTPRALHIARGHFKTFRDRGLFGKHRGMFWWNDMVRGGANTTRVVEKQYQVLAPPKED